MPWTQCSARYRANRGIDMKMTREASASASMCTHTTSCLAAPQSCDVSRRPDALRPCLAAGLPLSVRRVYNNKNGAGDISKSNNMKQPDLSAAGDTAVLFFARRVITYSVVSYEYLLDCASKDERHRQHLRRRIATPSRLGLCINLRKILIKSDVRVSDHSTRNGRKIR